MATYREKRGTNTVPVVSSVPDTGVNGEIVYITGEGLASYNNGTWSKLTANIPVIDWSGLSHQAKIAPSDLVNFDSFGGNVAIDGDTLAIGSQDEGNSTRGEVHVYTRSGTTWSEQAVLVASDTSRNMRRVIIQGDTIIAGAAGTSVGPGYTLEGAAYVFTRSGTSWSQQAKLTASDAEAQDRFGYSIPAMDGNTVAVAAPLEDGSWPNSKGAVYVFTRSGTSWSQQAKLVASDAAAGDQFGSAEGRLGLSGDTLVVGAHKRDEGGTDRGAVYVFTRSGTTWSQQAKITPASPTDYDNFGHSTDISGDTLVVGAPGDDDAATDAGAVYVYTRSGTTWSQQAKLTGDAASDALGRDVRIKGDVIVTGAEGEDPTANYSGAIYVFTRSGTTWTQQVKKKADTPISDTDFGNFVSLSGNTIVAPAPDENTYKGAVYVYTA